MKLKIFIQFRKKIKRFVLQTANIENMRKNLLEFIENVYKLIISKIFQT